MASTFVLGLTIALSLLHSGIAHDRSVGDPILIVPGLFGSHLDVRNEGFSPCRTWHTALWINEFRISNFWCFYTEMMLEYDKDSDQYSHFDSRVTVYVPGFDQTYTVEDLGQKFISAPYFRSFVRYFVDRGYRVGSSIRAAPYDWRLAPDELERRGYYHGVRRLIETMYYHNNNRKVTIVAHSMGGPVMLHFLTSGVVSQDWVDDYVGSFIPLSGTWAGINTALQLEISGWTEDIVNMLPGGPELVRQLGPGTLDLFRSIFRSLQSTSFLLPHPSVWEDVTDLVTTPTQTYTANDYEDLFEDIGIFDGFDMYQGIADINENFPAPNIPTHCFYGVGVSTPERFDYSRSFPWGAESHPVVRTGDGDGLVNIRSSEVCLQWENRHHSFESKTFAADHFGIVQDEAVLSEIWSIVRTVDAKEAMWSYIFGQSDEQNK